MDTWRDLSDQLTAKQIATLQQFEHNDYELCDLLWLAQHCVILNQTGCWPMLMPGDALHDRGADLGHDIPAERVSAACERAPHTVLPSTLTSGSQPPRRTDPHAMGVSPDRNPGL